MTPTNLILCLRAIDQHGSDRAAWELRREPAGLQWYSWPGSTYGTPNGDDWERVKGMPAFGTQGAAKAAAGYWFKRHEPGLRLEIREGA